MKRLKKLLKICLIIASVIVLIGGLAWVSITRDAKLNQDLLAGKTSNFAVFDLNEDKIEFNGDSYVGYDELPKNLINAFISVEDKRFFEHNGIDFRRIISASISNVKNLSLGEGASTITQQLIKNTHLTQDKTFSRKLKEIKLAVELENQLSKEKILELYLNKIYFGNGYYGVKSASRGYFNKDLSELSLKECAVLAGIIKNPSRYSPAKSMESANERANLVLKLMRDQNMITKSEYEAEIESSILLFNEFHNNIGLSYVDSAIYEASKILKIEESDIANGNYKIYTYYSPSAQESLAKNISQRTKNAAYSSYGMITDNEKCGVIAYYNTAPYFNAYTLKRSPGSLIKPFVSYVPSLYYKNMLPVSLISNKETSFGSYSPKNYNDYYSESVTLREALSKSYNVPSVILMNEIGIKECVEIARSFGLNVPNKDESLALALGGMSYGLSAVELSEAYSTLSRLGKRKNLTFIRRIEDGFGRVLYEDRRNDTTVCDEESAFLVNSMLETATKSGTARRLGNLPFSIFAKTGTVASSNVNYNDGAYSVAYNKRHTSLIWLGNVEDVPEKGVPSSITGAGTPTEINREILLALYMDQEYPTKYDVPEELIELYYDSDALYSDGVITPVTDKTKNIGIDYFRKSALPDHVIDVLNYNIDDYSVSVLEKGIEISFKSEKYTNYRIEKSNLSGSEIIFDELGNGKNIVILDENIKYGEYISYTITPYIRNFYGEYVYGRSQTKTVIIEDNFYNDSDDFNDYFEPES